MQYTPPLDELRFVMEEIAGLEALLRLPDFAEIDAATAMAVVEESGKFCADVIAPLNRIGDTQPPVWLQGDVRTSPGFKAAFDQFVSAGWQGLQHDQRYGGQGLPKLIGTACAEMLHAANLSFALCPLLTDGVIEALMTAGSAEQKDRYLPSLISGQWTGTMNLTEPQAGSDLAQIRTKAVPEADGVYRLFGQKIYITYGDHDLAGNIIHLVLARTPDAPEGVKGISLFIVPKYLIGADGQRGARNDVYCASIEHKLGIKASPTAVLLYGDGKHPVAAAGEAPQAGAIGYLVGKENRGLEIMFLMMNAARFTVGLQGIAVSDRAYRQAARYAKDRVQSRDLAGSAAPVAIVEHPDVKRMLMRMRALTEAARALAYWGAAQCDVAHHAEQTADADEAAAIYDYLVPIIKGWSTELSIEVTSLGVQVHGGMGFIEETGVAQYYRDARILPIYEGTTAIQANDLLGRKTLKDGGRVARLLIAQLIAIDAELAAQPSVASIAMRRHLAAGRDALSETIAYLLQQTPADIKKTYAGSVPYLQLAGLVLGGWQMARALLAAQRRLADHGASAFHSAKIATAHFYAEHCLSAAPAIKTAIIEGGDSAIAMHATDF